MLWFPGFGLLALLERTILSLMCSAFIHTVRIETFSLTWNFSLADDSSLGGRGMKAGEGVRWGVWPQGRVETQDGSS